VGKTDKGKYTEYLMLNNVLNVGLCCKGCRDVYVNLTEQLKILLGMSERKRGTSFFKYSNVVQCERRDAI